MAVYTFPWCHMSQSWPSFCLVPLLCAVVTRVLCLQCSYVHPTVVCSWRPPGGVSIFMCIPAVSHVFFGYHIVFGQPPVTLGSLTFIFSGVLRFLLRRIPLKVRAISAKIIYLKSTHRTLRFGILFKTSHCSLFLQVTPRWKSQAFSRNVMSNLGRMLHACVFN